MNLKKANKKTLNKNPPTPNPKQLISQMPEHNKRQSFKTFHFKTAFLKNGT